MTPQQILIVAVRLFAIVWFLNSIGHLVTAVTTMSKFREDSGSGSLVALVVAVPILELLVCVLLWLFPALLARRLLRDADKPTNTLGPPLLEWQTMAVIAIGLWTLSYAIPDAVYWIFLISTYFPRGSEFSYLLQDRWPDIAATVAQFAVGIWLLLGGRVLATLLLRMRTAGLRS